MPNTSHAASARGRRTPVGGELPEHAKGDDLVGEEASLRVAGQQLQGQDDAEQGAVPGRRSAQQALERGQGHRHPGVGSDVDRAPRREPQGADAVSESDRPGQGRRPGQPHLAPQPPGAEAGDGEIEDHRREQRGLARQDGEDPVHRVEQAGHADGEERLAAGLERVPEQPVAPGQAVERVTDVRIEVAVDVEGAHPLRLLGAGANDAEGEVRGGGDQDRRAQGGGGAAHRRAASPLSAPSSTRRAEKPGCRPGMPSRLMPAPMVPRPAWALSKGCPTVPQGIRVRSIP